MLQGIRLQKHPVNLIPKFNGSKFKIDPNDQYKIHWLTSLPTTGLSMFWMIQTNWNRGPIFWGDQDKA